MGPSHTITENDIIPLVEAEEEGGQGHQAEATMEAEVESEEDHQNAALVNDAAEDVHRNEASPDGQENEALANDNQTLNGAAPASPRIIKFLQPDGSIWEYEDTFMGLND